MVVVIVVIPLPERFLQGGMMRTQTVSLNCLALSRLVRLY